MSMRKVILKSAIGRSVVLTAAGVCVAGGGIFFSGISSASAATISSSTLAPTDSAVSAGSTSRCLLAPDAKASSHTKRCGLTQINYGYKYNVVSGKKRCYYFLATAWNPCSIPAQYTTYACKAI